MRNTYLLSILLYLLIQTVMPAQSCLPFGIVFTNQSEINSFSTDYPGCTFIEGSVYITGDNIIDLTGLNQIQKIGGALNLQANVQLSDANGLASLQQVDGGIFIYANPVLSQLSGMSGLKSLGTEISPFGLFLSDNPSLTSLDGLGALNEIEGNLIIENNEQLSGLDGLHGLDRVNGSVYIQYNPALNDLNGLNDLEEVIGYIYIVDNPSLSNLQGLEQVNPDSVLFWYITTNPGLTDCAIPNLCKAFDDYGNVYVEENGTGCSTWAELEEACMNTSLDNPDLDLQVVWPNPGNGFFRFSGPALEGRCKVQLIDPRGIILAEREEMAGEWDLTGILSSGPYWIRWINRGGTRTVPVLVR
ncbi:MAG: hypothetical protein H6546_03925 [Chitinophagales bacterium]|nr:hypothetical protein [Chitinophagales bacterium]HRW74504.1 hypothetical protein [Saprospiraceae bacterium]